MTLLDTYKINRLIQKEPPSGVNVSTLLFKRSPKSTEGGLILNKKIIKIFFNCMKINNKSVRIKTYCLLKRLINKNK